jgi:hypothetical protein
MSHKLFLVGRKSVKILERFDNSLLVEYVKTGVQACINPELVRCKTINQTTKKKFINKQTKLKF